MQTGWLLWSNFRFYLLEDGKMAIGWQQIEGSWYYFYKEDDIDCRCPGEMAIDTWVDGYFVNIDGKRV